MNTDPRIVALVPCKDGESSIAATVQSLLSEDSIDEVVVIDDGSADATSVRAAAAGACVITLPENSGKGGALRAGVDATPDADIYLLVDADTQTSANQAVHLLPPVIRNEADLVIGVLPSAGGRGGFGLVRDLAAKGIERTTGFRPKAPLSGQRAVNADLLRSLELAPRFGVEVAMTIDALRHGARVTERNVEMEHRHHGKTFAGFLHRGKQGKDVVAALRTRIFSGVFRLSLLIATTAILVGFLLAQATKSPTGVRAIATEMPKAHAVQVILVPGWTWDDIDRNGSDITHFQGLGDLLDAERPHVVGSVATGNIEDIVSVVSSGVKSSAEPKRANARDIRVSVRPLGLDRPHQYPETRIVMGVSDHDESPKLRPIILQGAALNGSFVSATTKRASIVDVTDIAPTVLAMQSGDVPNDLTRPLTFEADTNAVKSAAKAAAHTDFYDRNRAAFIAIYITLQVAIYAFVFSRPRNTRLTALVAAAISAVPLSCMVVQWFTSDISPQLGQWSALFAFTLCIIVFMSGLASRGSITPLRRVLFATILVLVADIATNDTLQLGGFFGSSPALAARYYGLGNVASVLLLAATVLWSVLHVGPGRAIGPIAERQAWWRALAVAVIVTVVAGTPGLGSDVGGLFVYTVTFAALFTALRTGKLPLKRIAQIGAGGLLVIAAAGVADSFRGVASRTHLGDLVADIRAEGVSALTDVVSRKVEANVLGYAFPLNLFIVAAVVAVIVMFLRGQWSDELPLKSPERIGAIAALTSGCLAYGVNDSGIVTLVVISVFLGPFLMVFFRRTRPNIPTLEVVAP